MLNPVSTYRIQFHKGFTFENFKAVIPYLQKLGVTTIYASPIQEAVPGSNHGYDGVNPHRINPEIGTEEQLKELSKSLHEKGINWLQDIVPNHMAYHQNNLWLMDVLEKGKESAYASFFDILWDSKLYNGKLMVPFLGASLDEVIEKGELKLEDKSGKLLFNYYGATFPVNPQSTTIQQNSLDTINSNPELLKQLAEQQTYQLCYWQETDYQINFRRFFTVNGLICINIQDKKIFDEYHRLVKSLLTDGVFNGLRIDHVDGLYNPTKYLEQLRELAGKETYIVVEKILEPGEDLSLNWPIQGNTGYDFLALVNNLLTNSNSKEKFTEFYDKLTNDDTSIHKQIREKKAYILYNHMAGELENLFQLFIKSDLIKKEVLNELSPDILKHAIGELLIQCPVYRYYGNCFPLEKEERKDIQKILDKIRHNKEALIPAIEILEQVVLNHSTINTDYSNRALHFYQRLMQFAGPIMAKGVEDTLMYTYNRYIGNNEVGDSPETFGLSVDDFHNELKKRQKHWPLSINATATHDTKRGEDASARLNALTDLPEEWIKTVQEWQKLNKGLKINNAPDANDEYLIYQALIGAYPMPGQDNDNFKERFEQYLGKALKEAKRHTNWTKPNEDYEQAVTKFASNLLDENKPFWKSFQKFHKKVADFGIINSLSKTILKFTCPGVPDVYQGCELWDLSMVDPDNRRPVNYELRNKLLEKLTAAEDTEKFIIDLWKNRYNAQIKLWLVNKLLNERKHLPELFAQGAYIPLEVKGKYKEHMLAFARRHTECWYITAVPLQLAELCKKQKKDIPELDWKDTHVVLPDEAPEEWVNIVTETKGKQENGILVKGIFKPLPFALLKLKYTATTRSAGVLMHITSLPSHYGIGDFGKEALLFADFLSRSRQKYWQLLPLNPTESGMGHSPYSSISSMAGNTLLLCPELIAKDGLLDKSELKDYHLPKKDTVDFEQAEKNKELLFAKAFQNFNEGNFKSLSIEFKQFCEKESFWLNDFATYVGLKQKFKKAWFDWPTEYKLRNKEALKKFGVEQEEFLTKVKWLQFMFFRQWKRLKSYCNNLNIQLFGDVPFYVSYDSADVWANPDIFSLDEKGTMIGVAGVPPDYFNSNGQLWGMPVYKWEVLKQRNYDWWLQRIRKNMELYDVVRLDHFRAFYDYWEVPAAEKTAINGKWVLGPGSDFFEAVKKEFGKLPFIAEDLGDINEGVHRLRDEFALPGMKVLQFAFGGDMPGSIYIPHNYTTNYIAYTGTHDNNTTKGWFRQDAGKTERKNFERYTGEKPKEKNINESLMRMAYASVAQTVIVPIQDVLGLDESARMNTPASVEKNWLWRITPDQLSKSHEVLLREWVKLYNR